MSEGLTPYTRGCADDCQDTSVHDAHLTPAGAAFLGLEIDTSKNIFQDSTSVDQLLGELAGFASVCWQEQSSPLGKYYRPLEEGEYERYDRVFDSERASLAVDHAKARLAELIKEK